METSLIMAIVHSTIQVTSTKSAPQFHSVANTLNFIISESTRYDTFHNGNTDTVSFITTFWLKLSSVSWDGTHTAHY